MKENLLVSLADRVTEQLLDGCQVIAVIGSQWGDEAKGKYTAFLAHCVDVVVRFSGGNNAGHTIYSPAGQKFVLHQVPCGILRDSEGVLNVCGSGMVIDPAGLLEELAQVRAAGYSHDLFCLSHRALLVLPWHPVIDRIKEARKGDRKIGTTSKGIGPAYTDRPLRVAVRVNDLLNPELLRQKLQASLEEAKVHFAWTDPKTLSNLISEAGWSVVSGGFDLEEVWQRYVEYGQQLSQHVADTDRLMQEHWLPEGKRVLLEGAQGVLLGLDEGAAPYVTSTNCSLSAAVQGGGVRLDQVDHVFLVVKAPYMTRVGRGAFPTELGGERSEQDCNHPEYNRGTDLQRYAEATLNSGCPRELGAAIRRAGNEYGATTGRPRRTGWLDLVLLRYVLSLHSTVPCSLLLAKPDVMAGSQWVSLCTAYRYRGAPYRHGHQTIQPGEIEHAVMEESFLRQCDPVYTELSGWGILRECQEARDLPESFLTYVRRLEELVGCRVAMVSVGPEPTQTVLM